MSKVLLGDHIEFIDLRVKDSTKKYSFDDISGISSISKEFIDTKANLVDVSLDSYKIVPPHHFAFNPNTARMGDKICIALNNTERDVLVSSIYPVFKISDNTINEEFLMLWFNRIEFDRYARYMSHGSAREVFESEEMKNVSIDIPSYEMQVKIVKEYKLLSSKIDKINSINLKIDRLIEIEFKNIHNDVNKLIDCKIENFGEIVSGATPSTDNPDYFVKEGIHWLSPRDLTSSQRRFISSGATDITEEAYKSCSTHLMPKGTVLMTSRAPVGVVAIAEGEVCTNQGFKSIIPGEGYTTEYIYCFLKFNTKLIEKNSSLGTTFAEISGGGLKKIDVKVPSTDIISDFSAKIKKLLDHQRILEKEISLLEKLKEILICNTTTIMGV